GLRLHRPDREDAVHLVLLRPNVGWAVRLGAAPAHAPAHGPVAVPGEDGFPERGARPGARRGGVAGDPLRGVAVLPVPGVPAGEHPDLLAVHLCRPDCSAVLALEGT